MIKVFWIVVWSCWPSSKYSEETYQVYKSSNAAYESLVNGAHPGCHFQVFEATGNFVMGCR